MLIVSHLSQIEGFGEKCEIFLNILLTNSSVQMADAMKSFSSGLCCDTSLLAEEFWCLFKSMSHLGLRVSRYFGSGLQLAGNPDSFFWCAVSLYSIKCIFLMP